MRVVTTADREDSVTLFDIACKDLHDLPASEMFPEH
jgi:hypothetical protein